MLYCTINSYSISKYFLKSNYVQNLIQIPSETSTIQYFIHRSPKTFLRTLKTEKKTTRQYCNVLKLIEKRYMPWYTDLFFGRQNKYIDKQQNQAILTYTAILRKLRDKRMREYVSVQSHFYVHAHIYRILCTLILSWATLRNSTIEAH